MDNGIYGVEQWLADASVFHTDKEFYSSCVLHPWNYSKLAEVFGCKGWRVDTYRELIAAVIAALRNTNSPSIIQVRVPSKTIPRNAAWKTQ
jgi:indolepyruvate decarboxylase